MVTLAKAYAPYGEVSGSNGMGVSSYGFTGEWTDGYIELVYLRSRWYSGYQGRFITKDTWQGDDYTPMSYNLWLYGYANPLEYSDPSGFSPTPPDGQYDDCDPIIGAKEEELIKRIFDEFGVIMQNAPVNNNSRVWDLPNLEYVYSALAKMNGTLYGKLKHVIGSVTFRLSDTQPYSYYGETSDGVTFYTHATIPLMNIYHEFGHVIDSIRGDKYDFFTDTIETYPRYHQGLYVFGGSLVHQAQFLPEDAFISLSIPDPKWTSVDALQHPDTAASEQWADMWANYVVDNINKYSSITGKFMWSWVDDALAAYLNLPSTRNR